MTNADITEDALLNGRIRVRQPARGYRANVDTLLLAAAVEAHDGARLMEAGCGVGAALLAVAVRNTSATLVGVERDQNTAAIARENVALNAMSVRVEIVEGDVLERSGNIGVFDGVFVNPPFDAEGEGRAPAEARRHAYITDAPLERWIATLSNALSRGAALTLVHRAAKLPEILAALEGRLGGPEIIPIRPRLDAPAKRVIVRARKGSRAPLRLLRGLDLHDGSGAKYTPETEAILRGDKTLSWGD
ncbi:tRNA1(Val) (adenine(37)-N6)-methyltransferase [Terricaulis sp.]|uniref:tRNA1(Val) (adenine(37)-N6)-methyltransferase n=1 Tax=Terricaulis sp. TaxID=2768686 RepID=UPI0037844025